jgi:hypothetical protein
MERFTTQPAACKAEARGPLGTGAEDGKLVDQDGPQNLISSLLKGIL